MEPIRRNRRLVLYKKMLNFIEEDVAKNGWYGLGFCWAMWNSSNLKYSYKSLNRLPELLSYKPKNARSTWWKCDRKGDRKRVKILKEIIAQMEQQ